MTYAVGGLIQSSDVNTYISTGTPNLNNIWSTGAGNSGYGQTALSTVSAGQLATAAQWASLITTISNVASHQGTTITSVPTPTVGGLISYISALPTNLDTVNVNRLNAVNQSSTTNTVATRGSTWTSQITMTFDVQFANSDAARYFFNNGGQLAVQCSHPSGSGINSDFNVGAANVGTIVLSSPTGTDTATIVGTAYRGTTKIGGGGTYTINNTIGYYNLTSSNQLLTTQTIGGGSYYYYYYGGNGTIRIYASDNGSGTVTVTVAWAKSGSSVVSAGSASSLIVRPPSTNFGFSNTWGTPTVTSSVTGS